MMIIKLNYVISPAHDLNQLGIVREKFTVSKNKDMGIVFVKRTKCFKTNKI